MTWFKVDHGFPHFLLFYYILETTEIIAVILRICRDNGKENGSYYIGLYRVSGPRVGNTKQPLVYYSLH